MRQVPKVCAEAALPSARGVDLRRFVEGTGMGLRRVGANAVKLLGTKWWVWCAVQLGRGWVVQGGGSVVSVAALVLGAVAGMVGARAVT